MQHNRAHALRIRNFSQYSGTFGSGRCWHIRWPPVPGLMRHQSEGDSLFGFGWNSKFIRETYLQAVRLQRLLQHDHECGIFCAAAGNHKLSELAAWQHEPAYLRPQWSVP